MRDRLLIRHFLWRFLDHDLVSPNSDRRVVLSAMAGLLIAMSLFVAVLVAAPYQFFNAMPPGLVSLQSVDDRFLFVSLSMLVMALAAVGQWDALMLDARDTAVLGPLPIPHRLIVRSKFAATALFALAVLVAWSSCPTLLRAAAVPVGLHLGWLAILRLTLAHGVATGAAGLFGFLAVLGLREAVRALIGLSRFRRISTALQAALIMLFITALLLLPGQTSQIGRRWLASDDAMVKLLPPLWFLGLHETLAGSVIDSVPRTQPRGNLARQEEAATMLYRSLGPVFHKLSCAALAALLIVSTIVVAACLWNSRRLPSVATRSDVRPGIASHTWNWLAARVVVRTALQQAGFFLAVQSMSRDASHRITIAAAVAVALSLMILAGFRPALVGDDVTSISVAFLATQSMVIGAVLIGFRYATRIPAGLRGGATVVLAWPRAAAPFVVGVKRAGWICLVLPILIVISMLDVGTLGPRVALLHLGVGAAVGILMMDTLFFHNQRIPLVSVYAPSDDVKVAGALYGAGLLTASFAVALLERVSFEAPSLYVGLLATLLGISVCLRRLDRVSPKATIELDLDEQGSLPTQRFSLSS
jgi:hypothetical protein